MSRHITFYSKKVKLQVLAFPEGILASFLHVAELIEEFGPGIGMPYTRSIGSGLFEIRAKGKEGVARVVYCGLAGKELVMLNAFVTKTQKTPKKQRLQDMSTLLYAPSKFGKSTWCSGVPNALFLATEPGLNSLEAFQRPVKSWDELVA